MSLNRWFAVADNEGVKARRYPTDLSDEQWDLLRPLLVDDPHKRGRKYGGDMRSLVDALFYMAHTGCQWRYLPTPFPEWTLVWSQFRRWSRNDTLGRVLVELHAQARVRLGRAERLPSLLVLDSSLARGASNGGPTFHTRGGPYGHTKGAKRVIAVEITGLPLGGLVVPASTTEVQGQELLLEQLADLGALDRLEKVMVDRGTQRGPAARLAKTFGVEVEVVGWDEHQPEFRPIPRAWRVESDPRQTRPFAPAHQVFREDGDVRNGMAATGLPGNAAGRLDPAHYAHQDPEGTGWRRRPGQDTPRSRLPVRRSRRGALAEPGRSSG